MKTPAIRFPIMLDSGAYSAWRAGKEVDIERYMKYLRYLLDRWPGADFEYVNLDVIGDGKGSYRNWRRLRDEGFNPLPVWHLTTAHKWLAEYLKLTDRVALSWFGAMPYKRRILSLDYLWGKYLVDQQGMPTARVHGMGVADFRILQRYPWWTVDSTSWLLTAAMGDLFLPPRIDGEWCFTVKPNRVTVSGKAVRWGHGERTGVLLTPVEKKLFEEYMKFIEQPLHGEGGAHSHWKPRRLGNARYYWEFVRRLKFPRPFEGKIPTGLWAKSYEVPSRPPVTESLFGHTLLYLAGNISWEGPEHLLGEIKKSPGLGRLTSYWYCATQDSREKALEFLFEALYGKGTKGVVYED